MYSKLTLLPCVTLVFAAPLAAQPIVDGTIAGDSYDPAVSVQAVQTQFGDNFSELDAAYCDTHSSRLYVTLTGNLENNFNKLEIFIDSKAGGEGVLSGLPGNDFTDAMAGFRFDTGFEADYLIIVRHGSGVFDLDFSELGTANFSAYSDVFGGSEEGSGATGTGPANSQPIEVGFDNSNTAGVAGGTDAADQAAALAVQTGVELGISLADLGYVGGDIRVCAFVNNSAHNFASNQFLGPFMPPRSNPGGDGNGTFTGSLSFDLADFAGDQFFTCLVGGTPVHDATWGALKARFR